MDMEIDQNDHQKNTMNSNTSEATPRDWEDFWCASEKFGAWYPEDFMVDPKENLKFIDTDRFSC